MTKTMTKTMSKTVLVTGATGFVAGHLLAALSHQGWRVRGSSRCPDRAIAHCSDWVVTGDLDGQTDWGEALQGVDAVVHLAGRAHILHDTDDNPEATFQRINTAGTVHLAQQALDAGVQHFVFISSIGAMTTLSDRPLTEESPCKPDTPYGRSKWAAEQQLITLTQGTAMAYTILRPTLIYGPGNPGNMERLIKLVQSGLPLPLGGIQNSRSLLYVGTLVEAIIQCLSHPQARNRTFVISDPEAVSTSELIGKIAHYLGRSNRLFPVPGWVLRGGGRVGDWLEQGIGRSLPLNTNTVERLLGSLVVDSQAIRQALEWQPSHSLDEGLQATLLRQHE